MATTLQSKNKTTIPSIQQINRLLLQIVNSIYLDEADTIMGIPKLDDGSNIVFRFRDGREIYDAVITPRDQLRYVEADLRSDSYTEGSYLSSTIPALMPQGYISGMLEATIRSDGKRRRSRCGKGKTCGDTCIERGDVCDRPVPKPARVAVSQVRNSLKARLAAGITTAAVVAGTGVILQRSSQGKREKPELTPSVPKQQEIVSSISDVIPLVPKKKSSFTKKLGTEIASQTIGAIAGEAAARATDRTIGRRQGELISLAGFGTNLATQRAVRSRISKITGTEGFQSKGLKSSIAKKAVGVGATIAVKAAVNTLSKKVRRSPNFTNSSQLSDQTIQKDIRVPKNIKQNISDTPTVINPPLALPPSTRTRPNPSQIEIVDTRVATPEEVERLRPPREPRRQPDLLPDQGVLVTDPRTAKLRTVSQSAQVRGFDEDSTAKLKNALSRVDRLFPNLPDLPQVAVEPMSSNDPMINRSEGYYKHEIFTNKDTGELIDRIPTRIKLNTTENLGRTAELTLIHEVGHYLDHTAVGETKDFMGSSPTVGLSNRRERSLPVFNDFLSTVEKTPTMQRIIKKSKEAKRQEEKDYNAYLMTRSEIFARAFTQYVANKSGSGALQAQFKAEQTKRNAKNMYWSDAEFKKLEPVMDKMFKEMGWN